MDDENPSILAKWESSQRTKTIRLFFDTDSDYAMENVQMGHHDSAMPFCVKEYQIEDDRRNVIYMTNDNHQTVNELIFPDAIQTKSLIVN